VRSKLDPKASMVAVPDSAFFADLPNIHQQRTWGVGLRATAGYGPPVPSPTGVPLQRIYNATRSLLPACVSDHRDDPFACLFPEVCTPVSTCGTPFHY
jgi:hypothetical protein